MAGVAEGLYHEKERKADAGGPNDSFEVRSRHLDNIRNFVLANPHYIPLQKGYARPGFLENFPFDAPEHVKELSHRIYYDTLKLRLSGNNVEWRIKPSNKKPGTYIQCVKVGGDTRDRLEIEDDIRGPGPDIKVFTSSEQAAIEETLRKKLSELKLFPVLYAVTQSWTYLYRPRTNRFAVIEHKHDKGALVTIFDKTLEAGPLPVFQAEQELKDGECDLDGEMKYLVNGFNNHAMAVILTETFDSKPMSGFNRVASLLSDKKVRDALQDILPRAVNPEQFVQQCMISRDRLPFAEPVAA